MSGYILCHTTHTVNKNKHVQAPGKTVKRHKIFSKTNTSDCDKNFENCQGIEKGMSRPECQSHWVQDRKRIRWGSTSSSFSDENIREYSFSRADLESRCWQNSMNPRKKERLGDLKKKTRIITGKPKTKPVVWKKLSDWAFRLDHRSDCDLWIQPIHTHYFELLFHWWRSTSEKSRQSCKLI